MSKVKKGAGVTAPSASRKRAAKAEEAARPVKGKTEGKPRPAPARQDLKAATAAKKVVRKPAPPAKKPVRAVRPTRMKPVKAKPGKPTSKPGKGGRTAGRTVAKGKRSLVTKAAVSRTVKIRELDPVQKCGPDTSVRLLYRVDELMDGAPRAHLVFFDRHGWYCEHGRGCPAVADVRKHGRLHHLFGD